MGFIEKTVIVTGAGRGIGRTIAQMYADEGARVVIGERNEEDGRETERLITSKGGNCFFHPLDVTVLEDIQGLMKAVVGQYGTIDILINNAGISHRKSPYQLTIEEWDGVLNTNLRGTFFCTREAAKVMKSQGGGAIVNIASTRGLMSEPHWEVYAASKGGIVALTHAFAISLAPDKIRVNAISPGWIETEDYNGLDEMDHLQHPAGRVGKPEDVGRACFYLTEDENDFVTGSNLMVDGGMTRKMIYRD